MLYLCHYSRALLTFWFHTDRGRENSSSYLRIKAGKIDAFTFLNITTRWSRFTYNFQALIGQNLIGEVMRKIYVTSWNLFTLTAEAHRVFCQLGMFLTVLFHLMHKMMKTAAIKSLLLFKASLLFNFWSRNALLVNVGNPISDGIVFVFHLAGCGLKSPSSDSGLTW